MLCRSAPCHRAVPALLRLSQDSAYVRSNVRMMVVQAAPTIGGYCQQKATDLKDMSLKTQIASEDTSIMSQHTACSARTANMHVVCMHDAYERFARVQQEMQRLSEDAPRL